MNPLKTPVKILPATEIEIYSDFPQDIPKRTLLGFPPSSSLKNPPDITLGIPV